MAEPHLVRIVLVTRDEPTRAHLARLLDGQPGIEVVAATGQPAAAVAAIEAEGAEVALVDIIVSLATDFATTKLIHERHLDAEVVTLAQELAADLVERAVKAGVLSIVRRDASASEIAAAVRDAAEGRVNLPPDALRQASEAMRGGSAEPLTPREHEVLRLLARGRRNREIADTLSITPGTVRNQVSVILDKLAVASRTGAVVKAIALGLVDIDESPEKGAA